MLKDSQFTGNLDCLVFIDTPDDGISTTCVPSPALSPSNLGEMVERAKPTITSLVDRAHSMEVASPSTAEEALELGVFVRRLNKKLDALRKDMVAPQREMINEVNNHFKKLTDRLSEIDSLITTKVERWNRAEDRRRQEAAQRQLELASFFDLPTDVIEVTEEKKKLTSPHATTCERCIITFEVEDLSLVPFHFLQVNEAAVMGALKNGVEAIPGIKVTKEKRTSFRSK